jgi:ferric-dicitrate binding protein FerR (iron transport regulator)
MSKHIDIEMKRRFPHLVKEERAAWRALMNDPRVIADPKSEHTPEIKARWEAAADAHREAYLRLECACT